MLPGPLPRCGAAGSTLIISLFIAVFAVPTLAADPGVKAFTVTPDVFILAGQPGGSGFGQPVIGKVTLTAPAPAGGTIVGLGSSAYVTLPASVTVPAGKDEATFAITEGAAAKEAVIELFAQVRDDPLHHISTTLFLRDLGFHVELNPDSILEGKVMGAIVTGRVIDPGPVIEPPFTLGRDVEFTFFNGEPSHMKVPASVTLPAGKDRVAFDVTVIRGHMDGVAPIQARVQESGGRVFAATGLLHLLLISAINI